MATEVAKEFSASLGALRTNLLSLPAELAETPWRVGGWTRKQIVDRKSVV